MPRSFHSSRSFLTAVLLTAVLTTAAFVPSLSGTITPTQPPESEQQKDIDQKLADMGESLPAVSQPVGIYARVVVVGDLAYLAGHISIDEDGSIMTGKLGDGVSIEEGQAAARRAGLAMLASLKSELGSLNRVYRLVKTTGMVNCTSDFTEQPSVINGCSQLFKDLWGEELGVGARSAVGMNSLPRGAIVEIEAVFELE